MTASVLLSRVTGLVREMVLAHYGGTGAEVDAYVAAFLIPELMNHFLAGGFLAITFIPIFQSHIASGKEDRAWHAFSNILTCGSVVLFVFLLLGMVYTDDILLWIRGIKSRTGAANAMRDAQWVALTVRLTRIVLPAQLFIYWGSFFMAVQYARKQFLLPALMPLCYNVGIILGGIFLGPAIGIEGFAWGVLAGSFAGGVLVQIPGLVRVGARFSPVLHPGAPDLRRFVFLSFPFIIGIGMQFSVELFRFFGLFLSRGAIASLNYAVRIMMIVVALVGQALSTASYPFLSQLAAEKKNDALWSLSRRLIERVSVVAIIISAVMIALAPHIVRILFERGAFEAESTAHTAHIFVIYAIGIFALAANTIVMRCFFARQNTLLPMIVSTAGVVVSFPLYLLFIPHFEAAGVAAAAVIGICIQFFALFTMWCKRNNAPDAVRSYLVTMAKTMLVAVCAWAVCRGIRYGMVFWQVEIINRFCSDMVLITVGSLASFATAALLLHYLNVITFKEMRSLLHRNVHAD